MAGGAWRVNLGMLLAPIGLLALAVLPLRVAIDPGHGYLGNEGAQTAECEREADVMLALGRSVEGQLRALGVRARLTRSSEVGPTYPVRVRAATRAGAQALISLHLDARGQYGLWSPTPGLACPFNDDEAAEGFAVLYSDEGAPALVAARRALARTLATTLVAQGFRAYSGEDYPGLFDADPTPGVFLDRRRLYLLRKPTIPSVIIETHHGLSRNERRSWASPETQTRFATALAAALRAWPRGRLRKS